MQTILFLLMEGDHHIKVVALSSNLEITNHIYRKMIPMFKLKEADRTNVHYKVSLSYDLQLIYYVIIKLF